MLRPIPVVAGMLCLCSLPIHVAAQQSPGFGTDSAAFESSESDRKQPAFMRRPAKSDAEEQFEYAEALEEEGRLKAAIKQYRALVHTWHESPQAWKAQRQYALLLEEAGRYERAFDEYQYLIDHFAGDFEYEAVLKRQLKIANLVRSVRRFRFFGLPGFENPERALLLYEQIVENAPNWRGTPEAQFCIGLIHETGGEYVSAADAYETIQLRYGASNYASEAAYRRAHCLALIADRYPRDEDGCIRALSALSAFLHAHDDSDPNFEAATRWHEKLMNRWAEMCFDRAVFYDRIMRKPKAAIIAYKDFVKKFPLSPRRDEADARLESLKRGITP